MEMGAADADKHTDGNRNHDGSNLVYGVERESRDHREVLPAFPFYAIHEVTPIVVAIAVSMLISN